MSLIAATATGEATFPAVVSLRVAEADLTSVAFRTGLRPVVPAEQRSGLSAATRSCPSAPWRASPTSASNFRAFLRKQASSGNLEGKGPGGEGARAAAAAAAAVALTRRGIPHQSEQMLTPGTSGFSWPSSRPGSSQTWCEWSFLQVRPEIRPSQSHVFTRLVILSTSQVNGDRPVPFGVCNLKSAIAPPPPSPGLNDQARRQRRQSSSRGE